MTNFSKSATCSINDAIKLVKDLGESLEDHAKYTSERSSAIFEAIDQASSAIENILLCLKQHEERIKELNHFILSEQECSENTIQRLFEHEQRIKKLEAK